MKLLIGSNNPGKAAEMERFARSLGFETVLAKDLALGDVEETGATFEENAVLKARIYAERSGLPTVADDGGLEIDALNGAPGVYSRRWVGENATDLMLAEAVIGRLKGLPPERRTARLRAVAALVVPGGEVHTATKAIEGRIVSALDASKIGKGLPYRALLEVDGFGKLYADLTEEEHDRVNQRRAALKELRPWFERLLRP